MSELALPVKSKIEVPVNEHGIPDRRKLIESVLCETPEGKIWSGQSDLHHVVWPRADYRHIRTPLDEYAGAKYRGTALLKVMLPREMHDYIHEATEIPDVPDHDVMEQWTYENHLAALLHQTVRTVRMSADDPMTPVPDYIKYEEYQQKVSNLPETFMGVLPEREQLKNFSLFEAQAALRSITKALEISQTGAIVPLRS